LKDGPHAGSESASVEEGSGDVVGEIAEAEGIGSEVLDSPVDGFGGSVAGVGPLEVGQDVGGAAAHCAGEVARSGVPVTVFKNSRPWVVIQPAVPEIPNAATLAAVNEGRGMAERQPRFEGFADMMAALNADA
jgi:hypothetical protein